MDLETVDHLLSTTRTVRKRLDLTRPVPPDVIERCIELAIQAPTGSNRQGWHFVIVTDAAKKARIAELYAKAFAAYVGPAAQPPDPARIDDPERAQAARVVGSAQYLADHMAEVPALIIACVVGRPKSAAPLTQAGLYGSILPAAWSLMLALRARGLGAAWTTLHLRYEKQVAELLGIPDEITQAVLLPVAYFTGEDFKPARRRDPRTFTYWNEWGQPRAADHDRADR